DYDRWVDQAISVLQGNTAPVEAELERLMEAASDDLRFEDAADYRDKLEILRNFSRGAQMVSHQGENRDVFALYREEQLVALSVLEVRNGRIAENSNFSFSDVRVN